MVRVNLEDAPRCFTHTENTTKLVGMLGMGRGTIVPIVVRGGRSDDPRMLFASLVRPLLPVTTLKMTMRATFEGEPACAPITDMLLDVADSLLGNNLCFLGRIGAPPIFLAQVAGPEVEPSIRPRVTLVPELVSGARSESLPGMGLAAQAEPQCHDSDVPGPAQVPGKTILSLMHLSSPHRQVSDAISHL